MKNSAPKSQEKVGEKKIPKKSPGERSKRKIRKERPKPRNSSTKELERGKKKVAAVRRTSPNSHLTEEEDPSWKEDECMKNMSNSVPAHSQQNSHSLHISDKKILPGATAAPPATPSWYTKRILEEERPDLTSQTGKLDMEAMELALLDRYVRERAELQIDDLIVTNDTYKEDDQQFVRYEIQLKYNEGRFSSIYIVLKQICHGDNVADTNARYALKTGIRNGSSSFNTKMKREMRILARLTKAKSAWAPMLIDSGTACDMPFIVMSLLDMNIEKLREMLGGKFRPSSAFYIAEQVLNGLQELHQMGFVHRDVKPTNICVGVGGQSSRIYLIDFGETVRIGRKIKCGTPDGYTLPYWSIDCHQRKPATEKSDLESWFYTIADLFTPSALSWRDELSESEVLKSKQEFWTDVHSKMNHSPKALVTLAETIAQSPKVNIGSLKKYTKAGLEQCVGLKKFTPEWVKYKIATTVTTGTPRVKTRIAPRKEASIRASANS